jgi:hypothetical protein
MSRRALLVSLGVLSLLFAGGLARAQDAPPITYDDGFFKLNKDVSLRFGALFQPTMELQQDLPTASQDTSSVYTRRWQHQMYIRRMRLLFAGKVTPAFTFFFDFEVASVGKITGGVKNMSPTVNLLDAQLAYIASQEFGIYAGQMLIGPTRNGLQGATALMPVNYGANTFLANNGSPNGLDNYVGRDIAVMARGFFNENRLEYRVSFSDGRSRLGTQTLYSPLRFTTRVMYDIWDVQVPNAFSGIGGYYLPGTYFGKKNVLMVGGGLDVQGGYSSYAGDVFLDHPMGDGDGLTVSVGYQHLDGGDPDNSELPVPPASSVVRQVPKMNVFFSEAGYFIKNLNLQPVVKFESRSVDSQNDYAWGLAPLPTTATAAQILARQQLLTFSSDAASEWRLGVGLNYVPRGHNFSVKGIWELIHRTQGGLGATAANPYPEFKKSYSMFTFQGQWMFF